LFEVELEFPVLASLRVGPGEPLGVTEAMIRDVVHGFYDRIRADALLGPVFDEVIDDRWTPHLAKMCDFWSSVLLMTGRFKGAPMAVHAAIPDLGPDHFERWLQLFETAAEDIAPPPAAALFIAKARIIAESLQLGIAFTRGEFPSITAAKQVRASQGQDQ
jgi:hemoglobin